MTYICNLCGHIKYEDEFEYVTEPHGERHLDFTCHCCGHGNYIKAEKCKVCGEFFDGSENSELCEVCDDCLEKHYTIEEALKYAEEGYTTSVEINSFIASALTEKQINEILTKYVEEHFTDHCKEIKDYCNDDKSAFCDFVIEREMKTYELL